MNYLSRLQTLSTPAKIQDFLDTLPFNHETQGETCMSPVRVLEAKKAHCFEGALLAAAALWLQGEKPLLMHLLTGPGDDHHALALFKRNGYWGAISKTNHAVLRYRDPIYKTPRELALSYFHEYFLHNGRKTLRAYSKPFSLARFGKSWITSEDDVWELALALRDSPHTPLIPPKNRSFIRNASPLERRVGRLVDARR